MIFPQLNIRSRLREKTKNKKTNIKRRKDQKVEKGTKAIEIIIGYPLLLIYYIKPGNTVKIVQKRQTGGV